MKVGELISWNPSNATLWPDMVVVLFPNRGRIPCLLQCFEPALIEVFNSKLAVETLDIAVLHRATRLNQDVTNAMLHKPAGWWVWSRLLWWWPLPLAEKPSALCRRGRIVAACLFRAWFICKTCQALSLE
jgi:hypothetical protein